MKVSLKNKSKDALQVKMVVDGVTPTFANTIRRLYTEEVPTLAIEEVEFKDNSSILFDETVALRLGLLPLKADIKGYRLREDVEGGGYGSAECEVKFSLNATTPGVVYADSIKFDDPAVHVVYPKTPIAKLIDGQKMELHGIGVLGKGKEHAKWCPGHCFYTYEKPETFDMTFESWGQMSVKDGLLKATEVFDKKLDAFINALEKEE